MARKAVKTPTTPNSAASAGGATSISAGVMDMLMAQLAASRTSLEVDEAQDIMFDAWEAETPKARIALARKALKVSADCADAYVLLATEQASTAAEAVALYAEGVAAGERALGPAAFEEDVGQFWGLLETRPYMRARLGLALALWEAGRRDESVTHAQELLRLNPNDNQGVREILVLWLLSLGRLEETDRLLRNYRRDDSACWTWSSALAAFLRKGDTAASRKALDRALAANPHVLPYLSGVRRPPKRLPDYYSPGDKDEAAIYATDATGVWAAAPGAVDWLKARAQAA